MVWSVDLGDDNAVRGYVNIVETYRDAKQWNEATAAARDAVAKMPDNRGLKLELALQLADMLAPQLRDTGLDEVYARFERPLLPVLADIEQAGVRVDTGALATLSQRFQNELADLDARIKLVDEFVNTWSIEGFREEGTTTVEMGWGTHEKQLPAHAFGHKEGPRNQICLARMGINTWVRSWVPDYDILGMVVRHGEAFTISDKLTVWDGKKAVYRPTMHYAYCPCDEAIASLNEMRGYNYKLNERQRIMYELMEKLIADVSASLESGIQQNLPKYLR